MSNTVVTEEMILAVAWSPSHQEGVPWGMLLNDEQIGNILNIGLANAPAALQSAADTPPSPQTHVRGVTPEAEARDAGVSIGIAMSVAFLIRDYDQPTIALEWWGAAGLTIEQCERIGLDEYDLAPIRAALAATATAVPLPPSKVREE